MTMQQGQVGKTLGDGVFAPKITNQGLRCLNVLRGKKGKMVYYLVLLKLDSS